MIRCAEERASEAASLLLLIRTQIHRQRRLPDSWLNPPGTSSNCDRGPAPTPHLSDRTATSRTLAATESQH